MPIGIPLNVVLDGFGPSAPEPTPAPGDFTLTVTPFGWVVSCPGALPGATLSVIDWDTLTTAASCLDGGRVEGLTAGIGYVLCQQTASSQQSSPEIPPGGLVYAEAIPVAQTIKPEGLSAEDTGTDGDARFSITNAAAYTHGEWIHLYLPGDVPCGGFLASVGYGIVGGLTNDQINSVYAKASRAGAAA